MDWVFNELDRLQKLINTWRGSSASTSSVNFSFQPPEKVNDHVYQVHKPEGRPSVEIVFFHGLQLEGSGKEAYLTTWLSAEGSELWPTWILKNFQDARILLVSYDASARRNDEQGIMDMYQTCENLVHSLTEETANVGGDGCPVILVGHSIGCLVIKELCVKLHLAVNRVLPHNPKESVQNLLQNVKGLFYYACPHHGSELADNRADFPRGPLFEGIRTLNTEAQRRNEDFRELRGIYQWKTFGIGEGHPTTLGQFEDYVVSEASARCDVDDFYTCDYANHFNVCRPKCTTSSTFVHLSHFVGSVLQQEGRNADNVQVVESLSKPVDRMDEEISTGKETVQGPDQEVLDAVSKKTSPDVLKSTDTDHVEPYDDQWLSTGLTRDTGASIWLKASTFCSEEPIVKDIQGQPNIASTGEDGLGGTVDICKFPAADDTQANGNEALRTRPRRTALQLKSSAASGGFLQDSNPYRKVYTSGSRRRSIKEELVITVIPDHLTADSKSLLKGPNNNGKGSEKTAVKGLDGGVLGTRKQGRDLKLKSSYEILQIMRKDMLKLEKQIPQNYMLRSWRVRCVRWQKQVQASNTVSELGAQVRDFRYSLLLTTAGGMSDEEWDMRIAQIIDSGDVELLVSLWGRLYSDVHKWLESKPKAVSSKDVHQRSLSAAATVNGMQEQDPKSIGGAMSSVHMTTVATLAAVDAVAEGQQDIDSSIKALLASTVKLLQQQSRSELSAVREALEWEKRHITAKLSHLEQRFANLQDTSDLNGLEYNPVQTELSRSPHAEQFASALTDQMSQGLSSVTPLDFWQGYETEEDDSDVALPTQDADGEATDMSDSD